MSGPQIEGRKVVPVEIHTVGTLVQAALKTSDGPMVVALMPAQPYEADADVKQAFIHLAMVTVKQLLWERGIAADSVVAVAGGQGPSLAAH